MDLTISRRAFVLLREALSLDPAQRSAFVEQHCADDPSLATLLRDLFAADDGDAGPLDRDVALLARRLDDLDEQIPLGTRIASWHLVRALGRGGMGAVYLAEREGDGFVQRGALKMIKRGMDSNEVLARFRRERGILARLVHPNIARLLDGGICADGRPYLVMEYVEGVTLDDWSARDDVDLATRIELGLQLADALAHAHRQLVVHRDLKPSNVLVDADGAPHLLDFGIAKLLEETGDSEHTATAMRFLTRAYAAPEQERGEPASTATDVYQLGVLLFELLSGARFHDNPALQARPTQRLAEARAALGEHGPRALVPKQLRGDLGLIVTRATDADPVRRYANIGALADDLQRWRAGFPVLARADSTSYRLRRFVARNRVAVVAATVILFAILGGSAVALWQAERARAHAWEAQLQAKRAREVSEFFGFLLSDTAGGNRTFSVRDLLDRAAAQLPRETAADAGTRAELTLRLAEIHLADDDLAGATALLNSAAALVGDGRPALHSHVECRLATLQAVAGDGGGARIRAAASQAKLAMQDAATSDDPEAELDCALARLFVERLGANWSEARLRADEAVALLRRAPTASPDTVARVWRERGIVLQSSGDMDPARASYEEGLRHLEANGRARTANAARLLLSFARLEHEQGRFAQAEALFSRARDIDRGRSADGRPGMVLAINYGWLLATLERFEEARELMQGAVDRLRVQLGAESLELARALQSLGYVQGRAGDHGAADDSLLSARGILERASGVSHSELDYGDLLRADLAWRRGDIESARRLALRALAAQRGEDGHGHAQLAFALRVGGEVELAAGADASALRYWDEAIALARADGDAVAWEVARLQCARAAALAAGKRDAEALAEIDICLPPLRAAVGEAHSETRRAQALQQRLRAHPAA